MSASEARAAGPSRRALRMLVIGEEHVRAKVARHYARLRESGVETRFYLDDRSGLTPPAQAEFGLSVRYAPNPSSGPAGVLGYWRGYAAELRALRPDLVEVYTSIHPVVILPMVALARALGVPVVVVCRGELHPRVLERMSAPWLAALRAVLRAANLVIYKEPYMAEVLARYAPRTPVFAWTNAIPPGEPPEYARDGDRVLFLNFFQRTRNLELVIRAAERVLRQVPHAEFHLVGGTGELARASDFYADLNAYEQELRGLIAELGLEGRVRILPFAREVRHHYRAAKVFLLPADHVYCNYALLEAMAAGVPPIVSADVDPDARLIVDDGVNGYVVPRDPQALADRIVALLGDEALRQRLGREARRTVEERFNLDRTAAALVAQYRAVAARRPAPGAVPAVEG